MKITGALFSAPMVLALLEGRKTQTRRLAWRKQSEYASWPPPPSPWQKLRIGDLIYVRETLTCSGAMMRYAADGAQVYHGTGTARHELLWPTGWKQDPRPALHMHREYSRLTLEVTGVRVQRLHEITDEDAKAEGAVEDWADGVSVWYFPGSWRLNIKQHGLTAREAYRWLWVALHGDTSWDENPDVCAVTFKVHKVNVYTKLIEVGAA